MQVVLDKNLLVLVILSAFSKRERPIDRDFSRALLSNITNENIDRANFDNIISSLAEMGYVVQGNVIQSTPRGEAVAQTLGQSSLNRYDVEFINKNVELYLAGTSESKAKQMESLLEYVNKQTLFSGQPVEKIAADKLVSNSIKVSCVLKDIPLIANYFDTPYVKGLRTQTDRFRTLRWIERAVDEKLHRSSAVISSADGFIVYSSIEIESVDTNEMTFKRSRKKVVPSLIELPGILELLLLKSLAKRFNQKGFGKIGNGRRFIDFSTFSSEHSDIGTFRYYEGFDFRLDRTSGLVSFAWFDPTVKPMITLLDYIDNLKGQGHSDEQIITELLEKAIRVLPSEGTGTIARLTLNPIDVRNEKVPGSELSYQEYWQQLHQFILTRDQQPTVEIRLGPSSYNYPVEAIYLDRADVESLAGEFPVQNTSSLSPPERMKKTEQIFVRVLDKPIDDEFYTANFGARLLTWEELATEKFCSNFSRLSPPNLRFNIDKQFSTTSNDPRSVFKFGPYSKEKSGSVIMIVPTNYPASSVNQFFESLSSSYRRWGFGNLKLEASNLSRYSPSIQLDKLSNLLANLGESESRSIAFVILPPGRSDLYLPFKEEIFRMAKIPVQIILTGTFQRIANGEPGPTRGLILQVYTKLLGKKEAAWILADPADQKMETLYVGIGFSSTPYTENRANSFAAMCDPKGGEIDWKPVGVPFAGRFIDEKWFDGFLKFVRENVRPGVRRIVVFRKGDTYDSERKFMERSLSKLVTEPWKDFNFISVINEERRIISLQEVPQNPESGIYVNLNNNESILVCSLQHGVPLQQGTSVPVRLIKVLGTSPIDKIVSEYRALTYLNWSSPVSASKYPLVVNIANRIAELVKESADTRMLESYLPL